MLKMLVLEAWVVAWAEGRREQALAAAGAALATAVASGLGYGRSPAGERLFDPVEADHFHQYIQLKPEWANVFSPLYL